MRDQIRVGNGRSRTGEQAVIALVRRICVVAAVLELAACIVPCFGVPTWDAEAEFSITSNPNGPWVYGWAPSIQPGYIVTPYDVAQGSAASFQHWSSSQLGIDPCVVHNPTDQPILYGGDVPPHSLAFHPGPVDQKSIVRWIAPVSGTFQVSVRFYSINTHTTDVHVLSAGVSIYNGTIEGTDTKSFATAVSLTAGQSVDFAVGYGQDLNYGWDTTGLDPTITFLGNAWDAEQEFSATANPSGQWKYGRTPNLNAGYSVTRYNVSDTVGALARWRSSQLGADPCVVHNATDQQQYYGQPMPPHSLALHPGAADQKSVARWTSPVAGKMLVTATFASYGTATTDTHVLHNTVSLYEGAVNGDINSFRKIVTVAVSDTLDFAVGFGQNGNYISDATTFSATIFPASDGDCDRISDVKQLADGRVANLVSPKVAIAQSTCFSDGSYYIEEPDRSCGIKVIPAPGMDSVSCGDRITLSGVMAIDQNGERAMTGASLSSKFPGEPLGALGASGRTVLDLPGADMSGLLARICGRATQVAQDGSYMYLNDGSGPNGVKVLLGGLARPVTRLPSSDEFVMVNGIAGLDNQTPGARVVRVRGGADITRLQNKPDVMTAASQWIMSYLGPDASVRPFSFIYNGQPSGTLLQSGPQDYQVTQLDSERTQRTITYTHASTGLVVRCTAIEYSDFPAVEWLLTFENTGSHDTPIIEDVQAMDVTFQAPFSVEYPYKLHRTNGAPSNPSDFEPRTVPVDALHAQSMGGGGGRSSNKDFPFFKIETGEASVIVAVGWSGQWLARLECPDDETLRVRAGLELTHFRLHPGEKVRSPRTLVMYWNADTIESNAQFRQLIYKHYAAKRNGQTPVPALFSNTCFTRGGVWLNETTEQNQISLINAYAPLGLEAVITDAGWFVGGYPDGVGNWAARPDHYPNGMGPVAAAAAANNMIYGLWFEPEHAVPGTAVPRDHPSWCIGAAEWGAFLVNFGLPEVQDYFFNIVAGFMSLPGFRVYRQDFNMDPLWYWQYNDAADRQGITEMKYIEGLYAFWDRIAAARPDSLREECASGGRRIDLETVMRMHIHQDSDYWFDNETDQCQTWGLSQYLPNNTFVEHLIYLDDYSLRSTMASSLCIGWIADDPGFNFQAGKRLTDRYLALRHLFTGAWYPLLPYSRSGAVWMASQYHRPDLDEGVVIALRRSGSPESAKRVALRGLQPDTTYELAFDSTGGTILASGADLMSSLLLTLPQSHSSELVHYRAVGQTGAGNR